MPDSEIIVPGGRGPTNNPLVVLAAATERQTEVLRAGLEAVAKTVGASVRHVYALEQTEDELHLGFFSYCLGCSETARKYVYPCQVRTPEELAVPPSSFLVGPHPEPS